MPLSEEAKAGAKRSLDILFGQVCDVLDIEREALYQLVREVIDEETEVIH